MIPSPDDEFIARVTEQVLDALRQASAAGWRTAEDEAEGVHLRTVFTPQGQVLTARRVTPSRTPPKGPLTPERLAALIDHTLLKPEATPQDIARLCAEAREYRFAAVCVNPIYVPLAADLLAGTEIEVATVVGFPLGATPTNVKVAETVQALRDGATEIDMVLPIGLLKAGRYDAVARDIHAVVQVAHAAQALVKVIIEAALLTTEEKVAACLLSKQAGADFVKTSTGFGPGGATVEDVALMRRVVGPTMGVKAAGGIRTYAQAKAMIEAGANRIGASAGVRLVNEAREARNAQGAHKEQE